MAVTYSIGLLSRLSFVDWTPIAAASFIITSTL